MKQFNSQYLSTMDPDSDSCRKYLPELASSSASIAPMSDIRSLDRIMVAPASEERFWASAIWAELRGLGNGDALRSSSSWADI